MTVNVYERYYEAKGSFSGVERKGALVMLISDSYDGMISYQAAVTFFPHKTPDDFGVSYDAYFSKTIYSSRGRRSKKREEKLLAELEESINELSAACGAEVFWDKPLREARRG